MAVQHTPGVFPGALGAISPAVCAVGHSKLCLLRHFNVHVRSGTCPREWLGQVVRHVFGIWWACRRHTLCVVGGAAHFILLRLGTAVRRVYSGTTASRTRTRTPQARPPASNQTQFLARAQPSPRRNFNLEASQRSSVGKRRVGPSPDDVARFDGPGRSLELHT